MTGGVRDNESSSCLKNGGGGKEGIMRRVTSTKRCLERERCSGSVVCAHGDAALRFQGGSLHDDEEDVSLQPPLI